MLSSDEFKILYYIKKNGYSSQRDLAAGLDISLGKVNTIYNILKSDGCFAKDGSLTNIGIFKLKPYKVDNAVIMAAGMSSRFAPLSYEKPKGVLTVKGEVLIERQIRQLKEAGINDITVVVGYKKEQFMYLEKKLGVQILVNEDYYRYNNTSTVIRVVDRLKNTYLCSSDNYFTENPFEDYVYNAYYAAVYYPGETDEWGLKTDSRGLITKVVHHPTDMWCMMGHVFFSREFSEVFRKLLLEQYTVGDTRDILWEGFYERNIDKLRMYIRKYEPGVILEFDSLDDLRHFDDTYQDNTGSVIFQNIAKALNCKESDITDICLIKNELPIYPFRFKVDGKWYLYSNIGQDFLEKADSGEWKLSIFEEFHNK